MSLAFLGSVFFCRSGPYGIIARSKPATHIILIELEETYVKLLCHKFGNRVTVVDNSANSMNEILQEMNLPKADLIVSSLLFLL